ncbi:MAG: ABC transporter ATP-binding protein, partial [Candidatus Zixiibacteriota bacterium]
DLTKVYPTRLKRGDVLALDGVNLTVEEGEIFGLLGPNGAGKTTLVKCLLGLTSITSGSATIMGLSPAQAQSRQRVGFLPENHRFPPYLTGEALLILTGKMYGMKKSVIVERSEYLLELVGMSKWADTRLSKYSKGMAQRIGLAQALMPDPDLVFLDEPTDGVDPVGRVEIRRVLEGLRKEGKTVFLNSHLLSEVEHVADRVGILSRGKLARLATVPELTSPGKQYEIEADIGDRRIDIPEEIGKRISISRNRLIVELRNAEDVNVIIDQLRLKRINIRSVVPMKVTLEQSFMETVTEEQPGATA